MPVASSDCYHATADAESCQTRRFRNHSQGSEPGNRKIVEREFIAIASPPQIRTCDPNKERTSSRQTRAKGNLAPDRFGNPSRIRIAGFNRL